MCGKLTLMSNILPLMCLSRVTKIGGATFTFCLNWICKTALVRYLLILEVYITTLSLSLSLSDSMALQHLNSKQGLDLWFVRA